ncbi:hypothetical protein, unlikely [Trypanosoma brucei gambiense DAL972]|uniref:Uncharacterized protein n=1 Tax=Trypanosoma brucei gambiense (strain MHOM/CI/86/DAL972) TaxID=679716 RepID=D0AAT6_TRYB9|nr:hypothetical protein, unlikely [Trypanosoma brucei gambiense DAL972]CBH18787.1 hypothetical protein, unlikely [Trypanosoma brucei gambiense DAL972]|eukprot:XP_011781051.1 hypothetical protein, unlikely [Trypanosoma brucei gambiense DAL972]
MEEKQKYEYIHDVNKCTRRVIVVLFFLLFVRQPVASLQPMYSDERIYVSFSHMLIGISNCDELSTRRIQTATTCGFSAAIMSEPRKNSENGTRSFNDLGMEWNVKKLRHLHFIPSLPFVSWRFRFSIRIFPTSAGPKKFRG